jgi:uncharacterized membrane protein YphA (DoxX/SURF4 family)
MRKLILRNSNFYVRLILAFVFLGHGLVSLGLSPSITLHVDLMKSMNFTDIATSQLILVQAYFDIIISILLLINFKMRFIIKIVLAYLILVCVSALVFYWNKTGSVFGIAECFRRFPWILFAMFIISDINKDAKYHYIRIGLAFAFIAHGFASLGFLGLNQGHIDLATNIISSENARIFITYAGISDTIIGIMLLQSVFTKWVSLIGIIWISFIVYLSFLTALPDAVFRVGFLLAAIYVFIDNRTYSPKLINYEKK